MLFTKFCSKEKESCFGLYYWYYSYFGLLVLDSPVRLWEI